MKLDLPLKSQLVTLSPFDLDRHFTKDYIGWLNNRPNLKYSEQRHHVHNFQSAYSYFNHLNNSAGLFLAIESVGDCIHIGNLTINYDKFNGNADVSILIGHPSYFHQGFGSEAWVLIINSLVCNENIRKVSAGTMSVNKPMLKLFSKSFMDIEAIIPNQFIYNGASADLVCAARYNKDFNQVSSFPYV